MNQTISGELLSRSRKDSDFFAYLDGTFSKTSRALPLRSLNIGTGFEEITFQIIPIDRIDSPSLIRVAGLLARPSTLAFSSAPMVATFLSLLAFNFSQIRWLTALAAFCGVTVFHIASNLFNDYGDHIKGQDRIRPHGGSRVIQKGWVTAAQVKQAAWVLVVIAALCGLPALLGTPGAVIAAGALLVSLEFAFQKLRLKRRGWAECLAFLLTGPLLTTGFAWAAVGQFLPVQALAGCIFGSIALMYFHSANLENIMPDSQAGARTWATRTGFDASKKFFYFTCGLTMFFTAALIAVIHAWYFVPVVIAQAGFLVPQCRRVRALQSPLSSDLIGLRSEAVKLSWLTVAMIGAGLVWAATHVGF